MFWDTASHFYSLFENIYNGDVNRRLVTSVADQITPDDIVLECACGTGMISKGIAERCKSLTATDFSDGMLAQTKKTCAQFNNITIEKSNILELKYDNDSFDAVVAGNVIHLLDDPKKALSELMRTCKPGGKVIIPTYVNNENAGKPGVFIRVLEKFGAKFKRQFDFTSYKQFFADCNYHEVEYKLVEGKMPCAIAIIHKSKTV